MSDKDKEFPEGPSPGRATHPEYLDLIEKFVDGEATPDEIRDLETHTSHCDGCRRIYEAEKRLSEGLRRVPRMLPPSELRAQILREAAMERERRMGALDAGKKYADALTPPEHEAPLFETPNRTRGRKRRLAAKYAPVAASVFVVVASFAALLTSPFAGSDAFDMARRLAQSGSDLLASLVTGRVASPPPPTLAQPAEQPGNRVPAAQPGTRFLTLDIPAIRDAAQTDLGRAVSQYLTRAEIVVRRMADAARTNYPEPAEASKPLLAALVLRPTTGDPTRSFDSGELERTLAAAGAADGTTLVPSDQFVFGGRRYRCYTVQVTPEWLDHMQRALDGYQAPNESSVMRALAEQGHELPVTDEVASFQAPGDVITAAASSFRPVLVSNPRALQLFVVDP